MASSAPPEDTSAVNVANFELTKLHCNKNKSSNYRSWKKQMLRLIGSQGLLAFIDGTTPPPPKDSRGYAAWIRKDHLIQGWILSALTDNAAETVVNFDSAWDVWLDLENNFSKPKRDDQAETDWHKHLHLYKAALNCEWDKIEEILRNDPNAMKATVAYSLDTALHVAVGGWKSKDLEKSTKVVEKLVSIMPHESLKIRNRYGFNPLHVAARTGNLPAAKILVSRLPDLLYVASEKGCFPVHLAADSGHRKTLEFLMGKTLEFLMVKTLSDGHSNPFGDESGLLLLSYFINADYFDMALDLVDKYPELAGIRPRPGKSALMCASQREKAFSVDAQLNLCERIIYSCIEVEVETESKVQHPSTDVENPTCEIRSWWPRRVLAKLNSAVFKVIKQLALPQVKRVYERKVIHRDAQRLVKSLCNHMKHNLKSKEAARIYTEAMLSAARLGNEEVIEAIVETFPPAIYSWDAYTKQNFLHKAVQNRCETVFNLIYQTGNHRYIYSDAVDTSGNNILHLAATLAPPHKLNLVSGAALQMQRELQWFHEADKFITPYGRDRLNKAKKTPKQVFTEDHKDLKEQGEKWMKDTANSFTITAALIVTVVFAAAITVPGGNDSLGYPMFFGTQPAFAIFAVSDAISLFTSTTSLVMFLSILTSRYAEQDFLDALPKRLCRGLVALFFSILFMMTAFGSTLYLVFGKNKAWILIPVAALSCLPITAFGMLQFPLLRAVFSSTYGRGIFGKQSDRQFH